MAPQFRRGTAGIVDRFWELARFARRYPYSVLMEERFDSSCALAVVGAIGAVITAVETCEGTDDNVLETDPTDGGSPEDDVGGES